MPRTTAVGRLRSGQWPVAERPQTVAEGEGGTAHSKPWPAAGSGIPPDRMGGGILYPDADRHCQHPCRP